MGRVYEAYFDNLAVTLAQDLFNIAATSGMAFKLIEVVLNQNTVNTVESLRLNFKRLTGTITNGTGGTTPTFNKHNFGDAAATCTIRANDMTTRATATASIVLRSDMFNEINGYQYLCIPDKEIIIAPSQALIIGLETAPAASRQMSGSITIEELY